MSNIIQAFINVVNNPITKLIEDREAIEKLQLVENVKIKNSDNPINLIDAKLFVFKA